MNKKSKLTSIFMFLITALVLSPVSTVLAINYEAQINVGFSGWFPFGGWGNHPCCRLIF